MPQCPVCHARFPEASGRTIPWECPACHQRFVASYAGLRLISSGEMGEVYEGRDCRIEGSRVAIKFPRSNEPEAARRFQREIEASTRLRHENIVHACEHGEEGGRLFLVMEFVHGERLDKLVSAGHPLPPGRVARFLHDLAAGLEFAASSHIVNRDIKPSNILVTADDQAKILDFGLALIADLDQGSHETTRSGMTLGTPAYMAPEQFVDPHEVTITADVYSLGCTIFNCLTGRQPFMDLDLAGLQQRHTTDPRPSIRQSRGDVSEKFERLVQRMMAVSPHERPHLAEIRQQAAALLNGDQPHSRTAPPAAAGSSFDVRCPSCGEVYHLDRTALGKVLPCRNARCEPFKVEPHLIVAPQQAPTDNALSYVEAVAVDDDFEQMTWTSEQEDFAVAAPADADTTLHAQRHAETIEYVSADPASADSDEPEWTPAEEQLDPEPVGATTAVGEPDDFYYHRRAFPWRAALAAAVVLVSVLGVMGRMAYRRFHPPPEVVWDHIVMDEFGLSHWDIAKASFEKFGGDFPTFPKSAYVPFFVDVCDAQMAAKTAPAQALLDRLHGIYRKYRDEEVYTLYANYLYDLTQRPVERFLDEAKRNRDPEKIAQAQTAFELFSTVAKSMKDDWVPERVAKVEELLRSSGEQVQRERSRDLVLAELKKLGETDAAVDPDKAYARLESLKVAYPQLAGDKQLQEAVRQAEQFEVRQVTYQPASQSPADSAEPAAKIREKPSAVTLLLLNNTADAKKKEPADSSIVLALARGVLYAFEAGGKFKWARRLGTDCDGLPVRIAETSTSPPLLLAASPGEGRLLALEERTGVERWSYQLDGAIFTAPTIVSTSSADGESAPRTWGFLPTATGDIHVLELVLGKRLGTIRLNKPLASGGKYDPATRLVYFPAENKRLFALDPAVLEDPSRPACRSLLYTNHPGGSLRSEPIIAGPYLILNQAEGFDTTLLRVFRIFEGGFGKPHDEPLKVERLAGWTWHPPLVSPDRVTFVTDRGVLGTYGVNLNLDASDEEALYRMIDEREPVKTDDNPTRSLAVNSQEQLLWVVTGGKLQKRNLDVLDQRITTIWPKPNEGASVEGIPVQESQVSADGKVLYLTLMSADGRGYKLSAVDAVHGKTLWSCALGHSVWSNPIVRDGHVFLPDQGGQIWRVKIPSVAITADRASPAIPPFVKGFPSAGMTASQSYLLGPASNPSHVAVAIDDGHSLALIDLSHAREEKPSWNVIALPGRIAGQPCLMGGRIAVPFENGNIELCELAPQAKPNQLPTYRWRSAGGLIGEAPVLLSDGDRSLVVLTEHGNLRRLRLQQGTAGIWSFAEIGNAIKLSQAGFFPPDLAGETIILADRERTLHGVRWNGDALDHWKATLPGRPSMPPVVQDDAALIVLDARKIACLDIPSKALRWVSEPTPGRICGQPVVGEGGLLVVDESRQLTILDRENGHVRQRRELPGGAGPAAAAVPFGPGQFLIPLDDGTLLVLTSQGQPKPEEKQQ